MRQVRYPCLFVLLAASLSYAQSSRGLNTAEEPLRFTREQVKRVSHDEAHVRMKISNLSQRPIFLMGINFDEPQPYPVFLEKWQSEKGWKTIAPCVDVPPSHVITLNPGKEITVESVLKPPLPSICKERNIQLHGRFRYRLEYFQSKKEAQNYEKRMFAPNHPTPQFILSEIFEFPQPDK